MEQPEKEFRDQLTEFFDHYDTAECKDMLWHCLRTTVMGNFTELPSIEQDSILTFYQQLNGLLQAVNTIRTDSV